MNHLVDCPKTSKRGSVLEVGGTREQSAAIAVFKAYYEIAESEIPEMLKRVYYCPDCDILSIGRRGFHVSAFVR